MDIIPKELRQFAQLDIGRGSVKVEIEFKSGKKICQEGTLLKINRKVVLWTIYHVKVVSMVITTLDRKTYNVNVAPDKVVCGIFSLKEHQDNLYNLAYD